MSEIKSVCIYCGSQPGLEPEFMGTAAILGKHLAENDIRLVYGGGSRGIMGGISDAVRIHGGRVTGIIPEFLLGYEGDGHKTEENPEVIVTSNMHERKQKMFELSDAFIALPGGIGTLEEIIEIMTWAQLGRHAKPMAFLNTNGFWNPLMELIGHMQKSGFIHTADKVQPFLIDNPEDVIGTLSQTKI